MEYLNFTEPSRRIIYLSRTVGKETKSSEVEISHFVSVCLLEHFHRPIAVLTPFIPKKDICTKLRSCIADDILIKHHSSIYHSTFNPTLISELLLAQEVKDIRIVAAFIAGTSSLRVSHLLAATLEIGREVKAVRLLVEMGISLRKVRAFFALEYGKE